MWGDTVGAVAWEEGQLCAEFEYDPAFLKKGLDLSPVFMGLEEAIRSPRFSFPSIDPLTFHGLPGLLAASLPDKFGNKMIDAWLTRHGRSPMSFNAVERLCYIGSRGMGALEFEPQLSSRKLNRTIDVDVDGLMELVQDVLTKRTALDVRLDKNDPDKEKAEALLNILRVGTSAGGAVPKAIIAMNDEKHIISGQSDIPEGYDHWILKFDGISEENPDSFGRSFDDGRVEYAYYLMAQDAGIDMMPCDLWEENGRAHFLTRRFDRVGNKKIHVLSLACMGHFGWNPVGTVGYEDAFWVMRELRLPYKSQEQQFRRMVFNALSRNLDDHTKNISYMMDTDGIWQLTPAYDITFSLDSAEILGNRHKMKINGKARDFTREDFLNTGKKMGIKRAGLIVDQIIDVIRQWPDYAKTSGVRSKVADHVGRMHLVDLD